MHTEYVISIQLSKAHLRKLKFDKLSPIRVSHKILFTKCTVELSNNICILKSII